MRPPSASRLLAVALCCVPAVAVGFTPTLSPQDIEAARIAGAEAADSKTHGYAVQDYLLYDVQQPLTIAPGEGEVEAVVVGTPFERLRYASYLASLQGTPMTASQAAETARKLNGTVHVIVFAHSPGVTERDRNFLSEFGAAQLTLEDKQPIRADDAQLFGPARDFYIVPGSGRERRWLGTVTWRFPLQPLIQQNVPIPSATGQLSFTDSTGRPYRFEVDLAKFR